MISRLILLILLTTSLLTSVNANPTQQPATSGNQDLPEAARLEIEVLKLYKAGNFDRALPLAKQVLKIRERLLPASDGLLADSLGNLAAVLMAKGKFGDAESLLKRALEIYRINADKNGFLIAKTLDSLAHARLFKGDAKKAEEFLLQGLSIKESTPGVEESEIIYSLNSLSDIYMRKKDYGKSNAMLERVIAIKEKRLGESDTEVGRLLEKLACQMYRNNQNAEAEKVEARANHILYTALLTDPDPISLPNEVFVCKLVSNPRPDFVSVARARRFNGNSRMDVAVETDEAGNVVAANYVGGDPMFKSVTEKAAMTVKLRPTIVDGRGMRVKGVISHVISTTTRVILVPAAVPGRP